MVHIAWLAAMLTIGLATAGPVARSGACYMHAIISQTCTGQHQLVSILLDQGILHPSGDELPVRNLNKDGTVIWDSDWPANDPRPLTLTLFLDKPLLIHWNKLSGGADGFLDFAFDSRKCQWVEPTKKGEGSKNRAGMAYCNRGDWTVGMCKADNGNQPHERTHSADCWFSCV